MKLLLAALTLALSGCVSIAEINSSIYRIDKAWQLDNQRQEDETRYRVVEANYLSAFDATRRAFLALGMPVQASGLDAGVIVAENVAPAPLTKEEWIAVKEGEAQRMREIGGPWLTFSDTPGTHYRLLVKASLKRLASDRTLVVIDYKLEALPNLTQLGIVGGTQPPPAAVRLGAQKMWAALDKELAARSVPAARKKRWDEEA